MESHQRLEVEFAKWTGTQNVVACSSGTAALHLALESLRLPLGSEVLVPDYTMVACARAVVLAGLTPVFVDCEQYRFLLDNDLLPKAFTPKTKAVMAVHVFGRQCEMNQLHKIAAGAGLAVVEDLAEAHGVAPHTQTDAACWSFYRNKIVAGEEGGAVSFREPKRAEYARCLRSVGFTPAHDYNHIPRGHNYRLANCLAEKILYSLSRGDEYVKARREIQHVYDEACPVGWRRPLRDVVWVYDIRIPGMTLEAQKRIVKALQESGVAARYGFKPMSWQPEFVKCRYVADFRYSERLASQVIYLPCDPLTFEGEKVGGMFDVILKALESGE